MAVVNLIATFFLVSVTGGNALAAGGKRLRPTLAHVLVSINGEKTAVRPGQDLDLYRGDDVVLERAVFHNAPGGSLANAAIDVEEFELAPENNPAGPRNEAGAVIHTSAMLKKNYRVVIRAGDRVMGNIKLVVAEPRFDYAVMLVNGSPVTVLPGGRIKLRPDDQIRLESIRSNIPDPAKVEVEPLPGGGIRFKYRNRVFGQIHLPVGKPR
jgi:hypothetical protein